MPKCLPFKEITPSVSPALYSRPEAALQLAQTLKPVISGKIIKPVKVSAFCPPTPAFWVTLRSQESSLSSIPAGTVTFVIEVSPQVPEAVTAPPAQFMNSMVPALPPKRVPVMVILSPSLAPVPAAGVVEVIFGLTN